MNFARKYQGGLDLINDLDNIIGNGVGVEVGVFRGELSKRIMELWTGGTMYMVDIWRKVGDEYTDVCNNEEQIQYLVDTCNNVQGYEDRTIIIRTDSEKASKLFPDESLDFIYIDANHAYEHVKKDLEIWFPKLKKGGVFAGHDYINIDWYNDPNFCENGKDKHLYITREGTTYYNGVFGVNPAVDEFCEKYGYTIDVTTEWWGSWWLIK